MNPNAFLFDLIKYSIRNTCCHFRSRFLGSRYVNIHTENWRLSRPSKWFITTMLIYQSYGNSTCLQKTHHECKCSPKELIIWSSIKAPCDQKSGDIEPPRIEATRERDTEWLFGLRRIAASPKEMKSKQLPCSFGEAESESLRRERREQWPGGGWRRDFRWLTLSLRSLGVCCGAAHILVTRATDQSDPKNHPAVASYLPGHKHTHHFSLTGAQIAQVSRAAAVYMPLWSLCTTNYYSSRYQNTLTSCAPLTRVAHKTERERVRVYRHTKQTRWMPFISVCQIRSVCLPALSLSLCGQFCMSNYRRGKRLWSPHTGAPAKLELPASNQTAAALLCSALLVPFMSLVNIL
jgi:hypothetical protein